MKRDEEAMPSLIIVPDCRSFIRGLVRLAMERGMTWSETNRMVAYAYRRLGLTAHSTRN